MLAYYILFAVPICLKIIYAYNRNDSLYKPAKINEEQKVIISFFIILFLLLALRKDDVGIDLNNYKTIFNSVTRSDWVNLQNNKIEYGYLLYNKLLSSINNNFQFFMACTALITVFPIAFLFYRESEDALLSISIFCVLSNFCMLFSGLRQSIAIAFTVPAYYCAKNKKLLWFIIFVFLAFNFHRSAMIMLLIYPLYNITISKKSIFFIAPAMIAIFIFRSKIFDFLINFIGDEYQLKYGSQIDTGAYTTLILFIMFALYAFLAIDDKKIDKDILGLRNILLLAICIQFFASLNSVAMRMNYYFITFIPVLISKTYYYCKEIDRSIVNLVNIVITVFFIGYFFYNANHGADILQIFPYSLFWR